jgi:hypothetical protein
MFLAGLVFFEAPRKGQAALPAQSVLPSPTPQASRNPTFQGNIVANSVCFGCHDQPGLTKTLDNGEILDLTVTPETYASSIHGEKGYACVQCHVAYMEIPHAPRTFSDLRQVTLELTDETCQRCHSGEYEKPQNSIHAAALAAGQRSAAVCADCHSAHSTRMLTDPRTGELSGEARLLIPQICAQCHYAIYEEYLNSVHGAALVDENNIDVPTCINCHGVHNISDPTTNAFRLASPQLCASCHTNPEIMDKYGISTQVLNTYVADFHGTTVTLFEKQSPDAETNKPVCYDCHGVHNIARTSDPQKGLQVRENLLARCRVCHPDATENFPGAWLSHYIPDPEKTPLVYYVNLFYKLFIPGVLGSMGLLVFLDLRKMISSRLSRTQKQLAPVAEKPEPDQEMIEQHPETKPQVMPETEEQPFQSTSSAAPEVEPVQEEATDKKDEPGSDSVDIEITETPDTDLSSSTDEQPSAEDVNGEGEHDEHD